MRSPSEDPDVQEALSRRYYRDTFSVLPLSSGKIAVLQPYVMRELVAIVDTWEEAIEAWEKVKPPIRQEFMTGAKAKESKKTPTSNVTLADLGL